MPSRIDVTPAKPKGEDDERAVLARTVEADRMYMMDRCCAELAIPDFRARSRGARRSR